VESQKDGRSGATVLNFLTLQNRDKISFAIQNARKLFKRLFQQAKLAYHPAITPLSESKWRQLTSLARLGLGAVHSCSVGSFRNTPGILKPLQQGVPGVQLDKEGQRGFRWHINVGLPLPPMYPKKRPMRNGHLRGLQVLAL
jgi:hypothetical protein